MKVRTRVLLAAGSLVALSHAAAHAQAAPQDGAVVADAATAQASAAAPDAGEIIVTATRENTLLSKTPVAITAIGGDSLTKTGVTNATQLTEVAPNLSIDRGGSAGLQITIRGVSSTDNSEKGDPSAGFVVDGVFLARPQAQEVSFFDLDRVEVLRGPQGTLYGRNTTAGLVSLISAAPRLGKFSASFDGTYGNFNTIQATGVVNVPVGESVAVRAAVNYDRRNSYVYHGVSPYTLDPAKENLSGRLSVLIEPSDRVRLVVRGDYSSIKGHPGAGVLLSNLYQAPFSVPADGQLGTDPLVRSGRSARDVSTLTYPERWQSLRDNNTWGVQGDLKLDLADWLTLNYIGSYRELTRDEQFTGLTGVNRTTGAIVTSPQTFDGSYNQNSQELRFAINTGGLKLQTGAYYFKEKSDISFLLYGTQGFQQGQRGYIFGFPQKTNSESFALFGQGTYSLADAFRLTGGVRWTKDKKRRVGATIYHANVDDPLDFTTGTQAGTTNPRGVQDSLNNAEVSYSKITWRGGFEFDAAPTTLVYGTVATGYKAGGFNDGCLAGTANCNGSAVTTPDLLYYQPETLTSYEAGFKARIGGNALRLNGSVFHYDYTNLQLSQLTLVAGSPVQRTLNAGRAKVDGVELESVIKPARNHQIDLSVNWLNARYTDYLIDSAGPLTAQFAGKKLDRSPEWTVFAGYTWTIPLGDGDVQLGARTRMSASYVITAPALRAQFRQPAFTKTDLSATYNAPGGAWYLQGFVRNIENRLTLSSAQIVANFGGTFDDGTAQLSDPRLYGVRAGLRF
ncbi:MULTISPECIES: TonB-dependent receptor [unclassified Novosphingobium]|uniref:TonB-dependent receptor n=1 Tax=unclassified Novosphingobium TaxID=2644732 RepID=UPI0017C8BF4D|nr:MULTISPECIES: TonB-dependent receptor [unclassified Novosphingobium]NMN05264.1 iron complex outermembrane receptor protein [Novosphingobium sp. SG919]NMN87559.1 iron complex outermembrane receptor protein [Novosphingobium sp. SG916]